MVEIHKIVEKQKRSEVAILFYFRVSNVSLCMCVSVSMVARPRLLIVGGVGTRRHDNRG